MNKTMAMLVGCLMLVCGSGCLSYSHYKYSQRAAAARTLPEGASAVPGRVYFASFPENKLALSVFGWHPNVGHAALLVKDGEGTLVQYDYGWFVGHDTARPADAIGFVDEESPSYGVVLRKTFRERQTNDVGVARMALADMPGYGGTIELWAKDVDDIGIAKRYMENFAADGNRGSMAWRCWQIGGYRCGNIARQAFDAARGEGHFLDLLWGGFPGADAPSLGTEKTTYKTEPAHQDKSDPLDQERPVGCGRDKRVPPARPVGRNSGLVSDPSQLKYKTRDMKDDAAESVKPQLGATLDLPLTSHVTQGGSPAALGRSQSGSQKRNHKMKTSNKRLCMLVAAVAVAATTTFAEDINAGLTFHGDANASGKVKTENNEPKNIDGLSFNIFEKKAPREIDWMKRAKRGSRGNLTCYADKDGIPTAVFAIGVAPVSKTMIASEAREEAQFEAESNAKEAFALWMKEFVSVENVREKKTLVVRTNGEEQSETETKIKRKFTQTANASWRGMSLWADALKDGEYIAIWRWSVKEQEIAKMVEMLTQDESVDSLKGKKERKVNWLVEEREFSIREDD